MGGGDVFLVMAIALPVAGMLAALLTGGRHARAVAVTFLGGGVLVAAWIVAGVWQSQQPLGYLLGGWSPPLGVALRADGLSAVMIAASSIICLCAALYAPVDFRVDSLAGRETRKSLVFWILLLAVAAAMNIVFLANDFFSLYVALELVTFAAVPLVALAGSPATTRAALRYLVFALIGSILYLLGTVLLYGFYGTLDISLLAQRVAAGPALWGIVALMTVGLAAKTALFPLHLWLPPAHAGAPPAASALLSALVVKASFFLTIRLWFDVIPGLAPPAASQILGAMGAGAIFVGGVLALRQSGLKLLIAYSTVAQLGYLFVAFPLAFGGGAGMDDGRALTGGMFHALAHAFAKASMFMAAGLMAGALGHDRISEMRGLGRRMPVTCLAFGLAALSLVGVPPTAGFVAKWILLGAAAETGQWWWAVVILAGGLLAGGYMFRVIAQLLAPRSEEPLQGLPVSRFRESIVLVLALCALALGLAAGKPVELLQIGRSLPAFIQLP